MNMKRMMTVIVVGPAVAGSSLTLIVAAAGRFYRAVFARCASPTSLQPPPPWQRHFALSNAPGSSGDNGARR